jgi:sugar phosphate isomerase/epimerase
MKIGVCTKIDQAPAFAAAGGDYIEVGVQNFLLPLEDDGAFEVSQRAADASPLPIIAANGFLPGNLRSTGKDYAPGAICTYSATAFSRAAKIGIKHVVFGSGGSRKLDEGFPLDEATDQFVALLKQLGPIAADHGVTIVIEPLRRQECNFINTVAEGAEFVKQADHPNIQLLADVYHMLQNGEQASDITDAGSCIRHAHLAENDNRTCPGIDGTDFVPFFAAFKAIGYTGGISVEGKWPNSIADDGPKAIAIMREQMAAAGIAD